MFIWCCITALQCYTCSALLHCPLPMSCHFQALLSHNIVPWQGHQNYMDPPSVYRCFGLHCLTHECLKKERKAWSSEFLIFFFHWSSFGEDADVSHLANASMYPLTDAQQHQCLFPEYPQMYWWMSYLQQSCLQYFSKPYYCGKQTYSQFLWTSGSSLRVVPGSIYFCFYLEELWELSFYQHQQK